MSYLTEPLTLTSNLYSEEGDVPRSAGIHLSGIIDYMATVSGIKKIRDDLSIEKLELYRSMGFVWERILPDFFMQTELKTSRDLIRPGEYAWCVECHEPFSSAGEVSVWSTHLMEFPGHQGIFATPDAINIRTGAVEEWKCTWKSMRESEEIGIDMAIPVYVWQAKAYCRLLETTKANIRVFWINGDYKPPIPAAKVYRFEWTEDEIVRHWDNMIMANLNGALKAKKEEAGS